MDRSWLGLALSFGLAASGCDSWTGSHADRVVVDSAGIEIVLIRSAEARFEAVESTLAPVPTADIGVATGPETLQLSEVIGAVRLTDGRILVGNGGTQELRLYDPEGSFLTAVGGDGEGPGEFRSIGFLGRLAGDTIVVYDRRLGRISLFDGSGSFLESLRLTGVSLPSVVGIVGSKTLVSWHFVGADDESLGVYASPMEFGLAGLPAGQFHAVETVASTEEARVRYRGRVTRAFRPFGRTGDVAAGGDFFFVLASSDDRSIRVYDAKGALRRILRVQIPRQTIDAAAVDAWIESWMARFWDGSAEVEAWWRYGFRETPPPDQVPVFRSLEVDSQGNVCAERYPLTWTAAPRYWCSSPEGDLVRSFRLPEGLSRPGPHPHFDPQLEIGANDIVGVWEDALDVEHVRRYRIGR